MEHQRPLACVEYRDEHRLLRRTEKKSEGDTEETLQRRSIGLTESGEKTGVAQTVPFLFLYFISIC